MSKIKLTINKEDYAEIENKAMELNKYFVLVKKEDLAELEKSNINYFTFSDEGYFLVKRGVKKKKFDQNQIELIREDLLSGLSIRKCATKYDTSTRTIQDIKQNKY